MTGETTSTLGHITLHTASAVHGTGADTGVRSGADIHTATAGTIHGTTDGMTHGSTDGTTHGTTAATGADGTTRLTIGDTGAGAALGTTEVTGAHTILGIHIMPDGMADGILTLTTGMAAQDLDMAGTSPQTVRLHLDTKHREIHEFSPMLTRLQ